VNASANLDLVRSIYAAWERGDFSSAKWAHPECEFVFVEGPEAASGGLVQTAEFLRDFLREWEKYSVVADEYREIDGERVLVLTHLGGLARISGLDLDQMRTKGANLIHLCGGKVTRLVIYFDRDRALADLGLAPEGNTP
jgi:ketosteroid isomerase-like protein